MSEERVYTEDEERMYYAWSDYRKEYGASGITSHNQFVAGWSAARANWTVRMDAHSMDWKAGFDAFYGTLDIGGVMR